MARLFDDALTEYLTLSSAPITAYPLSMACWLYSDSIATQTGPCIGRDSTNHVCRLAIVSSKIRAQTSTTTTGNADTLTTISLNTWHHGLVVFTNDTSRASYLDGGGKGTDTTSAPYPASAEDFWIGGVFWNAQYMSGRIAEVAMWDVALTDAEAAILAAGYSPLFVRPQNLVAYWPLIRDEDQDRIGGYDLTPFNGPTIANHPPIIYPESPSILVPSEVIIPPVSGMLVHPGMDGGMYG